MCRRLLPTSSTSLSRLPPDCSGTVATESCSVIRENPPPLTSRACRMDHITSGHVLLQVKIGSTEHLKASDSIKQIVKIVDPDKKVRHLTKLFLEYAPRRTFEQSVCT